MMIAHNSITPSALFRNLKQGKIKWAGNRTLKIYGTLQCFSGKRMKRENRVFFTTEEEALALGYRPCGHCLRSKYVDWKNNTTIFRD
nr:Ada metal-binding domain-containing protein [Allomuricauda sp.]